MNHYFITAKLSIGFTELIHKMWYEYDDDSILPLKEKSSMMQQLGDAAEFSFYDIVNFNEQLSI